MRERRRRQSSVSGHTPTWSRPSAAWPSSTDSRKNRKRDRSSCRRHDSPPGRIRTQGSLTASAGDRCFDSLQLISVNQVVGRVEADHVPDRFLAPLGVLSDPVEIAVRHPRQQLEIRLP